jgi:cytochrome b subunit of formate dehydrogenase
MTEEAQQKDRFWVYVGVTVFVIVTGILLIKQSENEKFAPIKQQVAEENAQMNIRVLN